MKGLPRPFGALVFALVLAACAGDQVRPESTAATDKRLAMVAGTWHMHTTNLAGDQVLVTYDIVTKAGPEGWTLNLQNQAPIAMRVLEVSDDSIVTEAGPYASVLRDNMMVTTRFVMQFHGDRLEGILLGLYETPKGRTTVPLRIDGTRATVRLSESNTRN